MTRASRAAATSIEDVPAASDGLRATPAPVRCEHSTMGAVPLACCDEATKRLCAEFGGSRTRSTVSDAVVHSYRILHQGGAPEGALPELVERLARVCLAPDPLAS